MDRLLGPGGAFEVAEITVDGGRVRAFAKAPPTLGALIDRARAHGERDFIVEGDRRFTYNTWFQRVDHLRNYLINVQKLNAGDVVAIAMKNCSEWMIAFAAIISAGAVPALINSRLLPEKLKEQIDDSNAKLLIADEKRFEALRSVGCDLPTITTGAANGDTTLFDDAMDSSSTKTVGQGDADSVACLFFTSGTTGRAKVAALTHRNLVTGVMNTSLAMAAILERMAASYKVSVEQIAAGMPQPSALMVFPLFHTSGCNAIFLTTLNSGGKIVVMPRWSADEALKLVEAEKITSMASVPTMLWDLLNCNDLTKRDVSSLRSFSTGGQALPLNLLAQLREKFPEAFIGGGYGMTETSGAVSQATGEEYLAFPDAAGRVLPMVDVRIVDDAGEDCQTGEVSEIWVKGAVVMKGYLRDGGETYGKRDDGWFATGDIGRLNEEGYLFIVDRKTDMVISGGENIYCAEVEQTLSRHADVETAVAFGVPDDRLGERLVVMATPAEGSALTADGLEQHAVDHLAPYCRPSDIVISSEPFSRNAMGKVNKAELRQQYLSTVETSAS